MLRKPPDILITTPESLFLLLTSQGREMLRERPDADPRRGACRRGHQARRPPRALGRAARPARRRARPARRAVGDAAPARGDRPVRRRGRGRSGSSTPARARSSTCGSSSRWRTCASRAPDTAAGRPSGLADDASSPVQTDPLLGTGAEGVATTSIWPSIYPELLRLVEEHRSTIVFVNNRRLAERLALRLNELAENEIARAHHGSLAREQRVEVEELLKRGEIPCLVATSSLELGIDMGAVDLVIQVESPEVGRAGPAAHRPRRPRARRGLEGPDLPEVPRRPARVGGRRRADARRRDRGDGHPDATRSTCSPSRSSRSRAQEEIEVGELHDLVRGAYPFADLSRAQLENVLDMLSGRYPSDEFAELRPRIVWDRTGGTIRGRDGARRLAVTNAGTIPDRGLFGVHLVDGGGRVGELDEEMVYEARAGQTFLLGASSWRIEEITRDRVLVSPAPGVPGAVPFWKGEGVGRPYELGEQIGRASRELVGAVRRESAGAAAGAPHARRACGLATCSRSSTSRRPPPEPFRPTARSSSSASATRSATGASASSRRSAPGCTRRGRWRSARGCATRSGSTRSRSGRTTASPSTCPTPTRRRRPRSCIPDPDELEDLVVAGGGADRALRLALPRERRPRAADPAPPPGRADAALAAAAEGAVAAPGRPQVPGVPDRARDLPRVPPGRLRPAGAQAAAAAVCARAQIDVVDVETASASPYSASLLFDYVATYMYEDDTPPAERRAQALSLDRDLLRELLGQEELRDLIDPGALEDVEG